MTSTILPSDLGLPDKFQTWRPGQWASIETTLETDKRFIAASTPTGGGKSVYAVASAILEAKRAIYLTSTKGLQSQLSNDFAECGMIDMRGRQNYQCVKGNISCADGRILECRDFGCPYNASRKEFLEAKLASTNYAYYLSSIMHSEGVGDAGMLILDEAHAAVQELCNAIEIRLDHNKANHIYRELGSSPPYGEKIASWRTWAKFLLPKAQKYLKDMKAAGPNKWLALTDQFVLTIGQISGVSEDWILDESNDSETLISPLWPTAYSQTYLFRDIPRIILASATLVPKTLSLLGIEEKDSVFLSQDHTFSPDRCPLYIFGACRVDYKMSEGQWQETIGRMDTLIDKRLDRKGIIHTTSYAYQQRIIRDSEHRDIMIAPRNSRETHAAIEEFRHSTAPRILVSPAITTGYDFPYCLDRSTKILTADLRWVEVGSLEIGDPIAAFDENIIPGNRSRYWREAVVTHTDTIIRPRYKLTLEDGTEIVCSAEHKWLTTGTGVANWVTTQNLRVGPIMSSCLSRLTDTWAPASDYDAGYLAAAYDGEGSLSQYPAKRANATALNFVQKENLMLSKVESILTKMGFPFKAYYKRSNDDCTNVHILKHHDILRFLGAIRPVRLLPKLDFNKMGATRSRPVKVVRKEKLKDGPVISIGTSTKTLVAEGFASHNSECEYQFLLKVPFIDARSPVMKARSEADKEYIPYLVAQTLVQTCGRPMRAPDDRCENFIMDQHASWFLNKPEKGGYRHLVPGWFVRQIRYPTGPPQPPPPLSAGRK